MTPLLESLKLKRPLRHCVWMRCWKRAKLNWVYLLWLLLFLEKSGLSWERGDQRSVASRQTGGSVRPSLGQIGNTCGKCRIKVILQIYLARQIGNTCGNYRTKVLYFTYKTFLMSHILFSIWWQFGPDLGESDFYVVVLSGPQGWWVWL